MELDDCAFPQLEKVTCTSDANVAFGDADYVLLVGAAPEKREWSEVIFQINGKIFVGQGKAINDNAGENVRIITVGNPCNTNALIAMNNAPKLVQIVGLL